MKRSIYVILMTFCTLALSCNKVSQVDEVKQQGKPLSFRMTMSETTLTRSSNAEQKVMKAKAANKYMSYVTVDDCQRTVDMKTLTKDSENYYTPKPLPDYINEVGVTMVKSEINISGPNISVNSSIPLNNVSAHRLSDGFTWETGENLFYPSECQEAQLYVYYPRLELNSGAVGGLRLVSQSSQDHGVNLDYQYGLSYLYSMPGSRDADGTLHVTSSDFNGFIEPIGGHEWFASENEDPILEMRYILSKLTFRIADYAELAPFTVKRVILHHIITDIDENDLEYDMNYYQFSEDKPRFDVSFEQNLLITGEESGAIDYGSYIMIPQNYYYNSDSESFTEVMEVVIEKDEVESSFVYNAGPWWNYWFGSNSEHIYTLHFNNNSDGY